MKGGMYDASVNKYPCMAMHGVHDMNANIILADRNRNESRNRKSGDPGKNGDVHALQLPLTHAGLCCEHALCMQLMTRWQRQIVY